MTTPAPRGRALFDALRELIAAIDRRQPQRDGEGERAIARDAASLRHEASTRVEAMQTDDAVAPRAATSAGDSR